jgi:hypothetical protein
MGSSWGWDSRASLFKTLIDDEEGERTADESTLKWLRSDGAPIPEDANPEDFSWKKKCLTKCMRGRITGTLYSVWEHTLTRKADASTVHTYRFIRVDLIMGSRVKGGGYEWGYKGMTESCGPCEVSCPLKYLDMVPDPGGYATGWREKVREWHAKRKGAYKGTLGEQVQLVREFTLTNGEKFDWVTVVGHRPFRVKTPDGLMVGNFRKVWIKGPRENKPEMSMTPA